MTKRKNRRFNLSEERSRETRNVWVYLSDTQRLAKQPEQLRMVLAVTLEQRAPADFLGLAKSLETFYTPFFK